MEESIGEICKKMSSFCNHLQTSCDGLLESLNRRPIPLDSASSTFIHCLNRRVSSITSDLHLLESMSFGTFSIEELLGHCNELYKKNQDDLVHLHHRLPLPPPATTASASAAAAAAAGGGGLEMVDEPQLQLHPHPTTGLDFYLNKTTQDQDDDSSLLDDTLSLHNLGLSDASLATIVSQGNSKIELDGQCEHATGEYTNALSNVMIEEEDEAFTSFEDHKSVINVTKDDYESQPAYIKSLAPWEDLVAAVEKMNTKLKGKSKGDNFFNQDEIESLGLEKVIQFSRLVFVEGKPVLGTVGLSASEICRGMP